MHGEPATLLDCEPEEGSRRLLIRWIDEALASADRVIEGADSEGLHDLRVALRKLRTVLRLYRRALRGAIPKKRRARLKELVAATAIARDSEVMLHWLDEAIPTLLDVERASALALRARIADRTEAAYVQLRSVTVPAIAELLPRLRRDVTTYTIEREVARERARFGNRTASLVRQQCEELAHALERVRTIEDEELAHEARIHGKRLRYLLEPLRDELAIAKDAVKTLKGLQDLLGELNDAAVRSRALRGELERVALDRARRLAEEAALAPAPPAPDEEAGLAGLVRRTESERQRIFAQLMDEWIAEPTALHEEEDDPGGSGSSSPAGGEDDPGGSGSSSPAAAHATRRGPRALAVLRSASTHFARLRDEIDAVCDALSRAGPAPETPIGLPREIERKYLLRALPDRVKDVEPIEIDQGYLPGERLHERLRRMRTRAGERWYRCVKLGQGISRIEIEEETSRELYAKLWPLTKRRRVRKRRYEVVEGAHTFQIDEFVDRELFLCEVELASETEEVVLPAWLAPLVEREVTGEAAYVNLHLAR